MKKYSVVKFDDVHYRVKVSSFWGLFREYVNIYEGIGTSAYAAYESTDPDEAYDMILRAIDREYRRISSDEASKREDRGYQCG